MNFIKTIDSKKFFAGLNLSTNLLTVSTLIFWKFLITVSGKGLNKVDS